MVKEKKIVGYMYDVVGSLLKGITSYGDTPLGNASATRNSVRKALNSGKMYKGYEFRRDPRDDDFGIAGDMISDYIERFAIAENQISNGMDPAIAFTRNNVDASVDGITILAWIAGINIDADDFIPEKNR